MNERDRKAATLMTRLADQRSRKVVFLSHCLLNESTRYLGGACRRCCVREIVQQCLDKDLGMVQMPCPEEEAWGGVVKRRMLALYGTGRLDRALLPVAMRYTRHVYRRLARRVAAQIEDYVRSGFTVVGVVAVDGSPSCGLATTIDVPGSVEAMSRIAPEEITVEKQNALVRRNAKPGTGIFIEELQRELRRRHVEVPFLAHDMLAELDGRESNVRLET